MNVSEKEINLFLQHKSAMMALAYRMLGSVSESEEIVQDVYIKWMSVDSESIKNPKAWLLKVCSHLAIDLLKKSYKKREEYPGLWLPEPVVDDFGAWVEDSSLNNESLSTAFLLILENLKPIERAVYLLHDIFDYSFKDVALMVDKSESHCRKIGERARKFIQNNKPRFDAPSKGDVESIQRFFSKVEGGELSEVRALFCDDPEFWSDGGGKIVAVPKILVDPDQISKFFIGLSKKRKNKDIKYKSEIVTINGRAGIILSRQDEDYCWRLETIFSFEFISGKVSRIFAVRNPDKFSLFNR